MLLHVIAKLKNYQLAVDEKHTTSAPWVHLVLAVISKMTGTKKSNRVSKKFLCEVKAKKGLS